MKRELDRSKASFKLDLMETANADPMVTGADLKLLSAFVSVMEWPSCRAWLSPVLARAKTGLSERQYWTSRARLAGDNKAKRPYLIPAKGGQAVASFKLINPWREEAIEHVIAMTAYHKESERQRKAKARKKKSASKSEDLSLQSVQGHEPGCPCRICSSVPAEFADKYPSCSTPKIMGRDGADLGVNVVPFNNPRKAS
ncbi:hypothetical protein ASD50_20630 [Mesorhizobium sp. Root552]|uniref:hypothetical protein n=1 Tax=Mesorhizobium sp. Root552 TaxID=1736555 RepID=UPI0006F84A45|nr:hypothetical protein [Mesorhizobium sp. Root552]KQZ25832.1 hypothetical protein ASD50_20630 [Mesorhizobium sp. Root552]